MVPRHPPHRLDRPVQHRQVHGIPLGERVDGALGDVVRRTGHAGHGGEVTSHLVPDDLGVGEHAVHVEHDGHEAGAALGVGAGGVTGRVAGHAVQGRAGG